MDMYSNEPTVQHKLKRRLSDLNLGYQKLDLHSKHPDDQWTVQLYKRLIQRDQHLYQSLFGRAA